MSTAPEKDPGRLNSIVSIVLILLVIGFTWRSCWYATPLTDGEMTELLSGNGSDSRIHKALSQFKARIDADDKDVEQWYDEVVGLGNHKTPQIRSTAAWAMGAAPTHEPFLVALRQLLTDSEQQVRFNAAVSLGAGGHAEARPTLRQMLAPLSMKADHAGMMDQPRPQGDHMRFGQIIGRIKLPDGSLKEIPAPLDARLARVVKRHGMEVTAGEEIFVLEPSDGQIANAVIALSRCGTAADVPALVPIQEGRFGVDDSARRLAADAIKALKEK